MKTPSKLKTDSDVEGTHRSKGEASRDAILLAAARLATIKGLDGLSIGDLAAEVGMSKSGLYAHFKSKEELELATIETATEIFEREVLRTVMEAPEGCRRLRALADSFLSHLERRVFPGGCFFAAVAAELDTRPGPARDRVAEVLNRWLLLFKQCIIEARMLGEIDAQVDVDQAVFEVEAMLMTANFLFVMMNDVAPLRQARRGVENVLARLVVSPRPKTKRAAGAKP